VGKAPRKVAVQPGSTGRAATPAPAVSPGLAATTGGRPLKLGSMTVADHGTRDVRGLARVEVELDDYYFAPTFLRVTPGQHLTLVVENESGTLHSLTIPALQIDRKSTRLNSSHDQISYA